MDVKDTSDAKQKISDVKVVGNPDAWKLVCKASSAEQGWMRSTKAMEVAGGLLVQVSSVQGDSVAEALAFVPGAEIARQRDDGTYEIA